jgi:hypothetical protein
LLTDICDRKTAEAQLYAEKERAQVTLASIETQSSPTQMDLSVFESGGRVADLALPARRKGCR